MCICSVYVYVYVDAYVYNNPLIATERRYRFVEGYIRVIGSTIHACDDGYVYIFI